MAPLREALEDLRDGGYQQRYNGRPSCPFCDNFVDYEETHRPDCVLVAALAATPAEEDPEEQDAAGQPYGYEPMTDDTGPNGEPVYRPPTVDEAREALLATMYHPRPEDVAEDDALVDALIAAVRAEEGTLRGSAVSVRDVYMFEAGLDDGRAAALDAWKEWVETEWANATLTGFVHDRALAAIARAAREDDR